MNRFKHILLIINSESNRKNILKVEEYFKKKYHKNIENKTFTIVVTEDENSIKNHCKQFSQSYYNSLIIACGGDGTVHEVVNSIDFKNTSIAVIPNGTGNDLATFIYDNKTLDDILDNLDKVTFKDIDLLKVNEYYCINATSFGYDTIVLHKAIEIRKKYPFLGKYSYKLAIPFTLMNKAPLDYEYNLTLSSGEQISGKGKYLISAICNGKFFGKGFQPAPDAKLDDNIVEFNQIDDIGLIRLATLIPTYKNGSHVNDVKESHNYKVVAGTIKPKRGSIFGNIDGEIYNFDNIEFSIVPKAVNIMFLE